MAGDVQSGAPAVEPVSRAEAKLHLRVSDTTDDDLIDTLIAAARTHVENVTGRQLITATWTLYLESWPARLQLPHPPLQSVTSITYVDFNGDTQTLSTGLYDVNVYPTGDGEVVRGYTDSWPAVRGHLNDVTVTYVAGYGDAATDVPAAIVQACQLLIGHWYANREAVVTGTISTEIQFTVDALLSPYRLWRTL